MYSLRYLSVYTICTRYNIKAYLFLKKQKRPLLIMRLLAFLLKYTHYQYERKRNISAVSNSNSTYLVSLFNNVNSKFDKHLQVYLNYRNNYFFWYFFNQDALTNIFVNLLMVKGNKYVSYKHVYKSFFFIKQTTGIQPLTFFKNFLSKNRLLFDIKTLVLKKRVILVPSLLSVKSQITKSLKYLLNSFKLSSWYSGRKNRPLYKKLGYLLLNSVFNVSNLKKILLKDKNALFKYFGHIKKEEYYNKYIQNLKNRSRINMFKIKNKSKTKKMKILASRVKFMQRIKDTIDTKKKFLLNRYNMNLQCKKKIRTKWF